MRKAQYQRIGELNTESLVLKTQICSVKPPISSSPVSLPSPLVSPYVPASRTSVGRIEPKGPTVTMPSTSNAPIMSTVATSAATGRPVSVHASVSTTSRSTPTTSLSTSASTLASVPSLSSLTSTVGASAATAPVTLLPATYTAPLLSQLPQIPRFSGDETNDGETFQDWLEQFESVATLGGWSEHGKLVNLTTRLRGAAYSFYRSCTLEQRSSYSLLTAELKKRFTPVKLTAIQTQLFHDRVQGAKESVDEYAQALRKR